MGVLQKREDALLKNGRRRHFFFNTFFFEMLSGGNSGSYNYKQVQRWTTRKKVEYNELIFI